MALSHQRPDLERLVHGSIVYHLAYEMALGLAPPTAQRSRSRFPVPSRRRAGGVGPTFISLHHPSNDTRYTHTPRHLIVSIRHHQSSKVDRHLILCSHSNLL